MPQLSFAVCPLPSDRATARAMASLLAELGGEQVAIFCQDPHQAPAAWGHRHRLLPLGDLAHERGSGAVAAPVYLHDGGPGEAALRRAAERVPGLAIAAATLPALADLRRRVAGVTAGPVAATGAAPTVEAVVLSYNSAHYVAPCLHSLLLQDWPGLAITVIDNASRDGTAAFVRREFPSIEVIESRTNLGFAAGHNVMFDRSRADFVVLLNHDAVARRDFVRELVDAARALPAGAAFGAKMLMRRCPTILNSTGIAMNEGGFAIDRDIGRPDLAIADAPERVFAVCGGAMMMRGDVLRRIGGFDPAFFMYVEDVDWCWRARLAGHEIYYVPTAVVVHDWHGDMAAAGRQQEPRSAAAIAELEGRRRTMVERNRLQAVIKNYQRGNLRRVWKQMVQYDRGRVQALRAHVAAGGGPLPQRVLEAVQSARRWCRHHTIGLWLRRRRAQQLRAVPDSAFADLIAGGVNEPVGVGDLHAIVDRHCAVPRARIVMALADGGSLGPGWHHGEPGGESGGRRWSMGDFWFYLQGDRAWSIVQITVVPQPRDTFVELRVDGIAVGRVEVPRDQPHTLRLPLPEPVPAGRLVECRVHCGVFVPAQEGMGNDTRELGLCVTTIECA